MSFQHKEGKGSMFWNTGKTPDKESWPDWKGDFMLNGKLYEIAGWNKSTRGGDRMMGLSVKEKQERQTDYESQADKSFDDLSPF